MHIMKPKITILILLIFVNIHCFCNNDKQEKQIVVKSDSVEQSWLEGSWGITFPVFGGERLDAEVASGYELVSGAQEVVDELPTVGYVITNLSYFAHSHYFPMSANTNVDVANEIHPSLVPNSDNDSIIFEVLQIFKNSEKKIILYISTNYLDRASDEVKAAWLTYYTNNFGGNEYLAYRDLIQGFVESVKDYADGYWFDTGGALQNDGHYDDFVDMFRAVDPSALIGSGGGTYLSENGSLVYVDSDGFGDENPINYKIVMHEPRDDSDFTKGHITPLGQGAPPNSWAYEEFTIPNMMAEPVVEYNGKSVVKHGWFPIRTQWHVSRADIVFGTEQAYRFVRRITDAGAAITFANTIDGVENPGHMMPDEMKIMKEINRRLQMDPMMEYIPYTRPAGAKLVGETFPDDYQYITFPELAAKNSGDASFSPGATASSGLPVNYTSSDADVAVIINNEIFIVGAGNSIISASQGGDSDNAAATDVMQRLTVTAEAIEGTNIALSGTATQSSNHPDGDGEAWRAIDGNTTGRWSSGTVTRTSIELKPWWQVEFGSNHSIGELTIFGRTDDCCNTRMSDYTVYVLNSAGDTTYSQSSTSPPKPSVTFNTGGIQGSIVKVQMNVPDSIVLNLAEVQVIEYDHEVSITVTDAITKDSIPHTMLTINDQVYLTNSQGKASIYLPKNEYSFTLDKKAYYSHTQAIDIVKDTTISLQLTAKPQYALYFKVTDDTTNTELSGVLLTIDGQDYTTDNSGEVSVTLYEDEYDYSLSLTAYQTLNQSINLVKDTLVRLQMERVRYKLEFQVRDSETEINIPAVSIAINDSVYEADAQGIVALTILPGEYSYTISKDGYDEEAGFITLSQDTTLTILMSPLPSDLNQTLFGNEIKIYPNPVNDILNIEITGSIMAKVDIVNSEGQTVLSHDIREGIGTINVSQLSAGIYIVKVVKERQVSKCTLMVK
jgi:hypothetical protein